MTARNAAGQTPLMEAVRFGNLAAVSAMVSVADDQTVALRDPNGLSALDYLERQESTPLRSAMRQAFARANRVAKEHQDSPAAAPAVQPESNRVRRFHRDKDGVIRELPDLPDVGAGLAERIVQSRQTSQTDAVFVPRRPASR